jgi:hypothetical protein
MTGRVEKKAIDFYLTWVVYDKKVDIWRTVLIEWVRCSALTIIQNEKKRNGEDSRKWDCKGDIKDDIRWKMSVLDDHSSGFP